MNATLHPMAAALRAPRPHLADPGVWLWTIAGVAWVVLVLGGHHHQIFRLGASIPSAPAGAALFFAFWLEMIVAMMLPTTVPMVRMFVRVSAGEPHRVAARAALLGGYSTLWMAFAIVALAAATGVGIALGPSWLDTRPYAVLAAMLALAGAFQLSPFKAHYLTRCRSPMPFLFAHYRRGRCAAFTLGLRHGVSCLGCCWALMLVMCGTGMASLPAMGILTAIMVLERATRWGSHVRMPTGVALLLAALIVGLWGNAGWGLYMPPDAMHAM